MERERMKITWSAITAAEMMNSERELKKLSLMFTLLCTPVIHVMEIPYSLTFPVIGTKLTGITCRDFIAPDESFVIIIKVWTW